MKKLLVAATLVISTGTVFSSAANAAGCLKGAAVGAMVGHVAGHHALLGAVAGCAIGRHSAKVKVQKAKVKGEQQARSYL